jgi:hypothetical protein
MEAGFPDDTAQHQSVLQGLAAKSLLNR